MIKNTFRSLLELVFEMNFIKKSEDFDSKKVRINHFFADKHVYFIENTNELCEGHIL